MENSISVPHLVKRCLNAVDSDIVKLVETKLEHLKFLFSSYSGTGIVTFNRHLGYFSRKSKTIIDKIDDADLQHVLNNFLTYIICLAKFVEISFTNSGEDRSKIAKELQIYFTNLPTMLNNSAHNEIIYSLGVIERMLSIDKNYLHSGIGGDSKTYVIADTFRANYRNYTFKNLLNYCNGLSNCNVRIENCLSRYNFYEELYVCRSKIEIIYY